MLRPLYYVLLALILCHCARPTATQPAETSGRRLEVLFLGDDGPHQPADRAATLMAALGPKGVNVTYQSDVAKLTPDYLRHFDALLIFSDHDSLPQPQEDALKRYVQDGHGLVVVHERGFKNSAVYTEMLNGRAKVDTLQQAYGAGRVFYTKQGHGEADWARPAFRQQLERAIFWAVGDDARARLAALDARPFTYTEAKLPNYEQRTGPQLRQTPLTPAESMKHLQVAPGFSLELFAHEPDVMHPIAMTWDEQGRMYVLITKDYPNERKPIGAGLPGGQDYILRCEDTNGDGRADRFVRFAEGLSIPTGLVCANGGMIVSQAPDMLFLRDTDGDGKADERRTLFTGFGTFDTHAGPSHLRYGFDNWIWGSVGYSGFKGKIGPDSLKFGQGYFRFKPDGSALEFITGTSNNTWGLGFNEAGEVFGSTANNAHGWFTAIPNRYFPGSSGPGGRSIDTHKAMQPITEAVRQVDVFGGFTAASGQSVYTARAFPKEYWNRVAFVCEPTGHIVHQNVLTRQGTDYVDQLGGGVGFNLLAGADEWFAPVAAEVGPDGAVWIADWYSFIIQHNPTPKGFENGPGNAYETNLRDYTHGRLYRVTWKEAPRYVPMRLSKDRPAELVATLKHDNLFWRLQAQRLLVERGPQDVLPQLMALVNDTSVDEMGQNPAALHALWTLAGLGADLNVATNALRHPAAPVRRAAVQLLPKNETAGLLGTLADVDPAVQLAAVLALSERSDAGVAPALLSRMDVAPATDRWLPDAFAVALANRNATLLRAYLSQQPNVAPATNGAAAMAGAGHEHHHSAAPAQTRPGVPATLPKNGLYISAIRSEPAQPDLRQTARISIDVTNGSSTALPAGTPVPLAVTVEGQQQRIAFVSRTFAKGLAPGETATIRQSNNGPWVGEMGVAFDRPGDYTITAKLDPDVTLSTADRAPVSHTLMYRAPARLADLAVERSARYYATIAPADSLVELLRSAGAFRSLVLKGVADGWPAKRTATLSNADRAFVATLQNDLSVDRYAKLATAWGIATSVAPDPNVQVIRLKAVREAMRYEPRELTVTAGQPVELVFENPDAMQHNVVIGASGSLNAIGTAADKLITASDGAAKHYVPTSPLVLASTPLVEPGQTYSLRFMAPTKPGNYVFVCTFPGHWRLMNGTLRVTAGGAAVAK